MPNLEITIHGRRYTIACEAHQEERLKNLAAYVEQRLKDVLKGAPHVSEAHGLVFVSLLLADEYLELKNKPQADNDRFQEERNDVVDTLEKLAVRLEGLAKKLEQA